MLDSLGCGGKPLLHVLNKCDRVPEEERFPLLGTSVRISARTGEGLPQLLAEIDRLLPGQWARAALCIPFDRGDLTDRLHRRVRCWQRITLRQVPACKCWPTRRFWKNCAPILFNRTVLICPAAAYFVMRW